MRIVDCSLESPFEALNQRTTQRSSEAEHVVAQIIEDLRTRGDAALLDNARQFDAPHLERLRVTEQELSQAVVEPRFAEAIKIATDRVRRFHTEQKDRFLAGLTQFEAPAASRGEPVAAVVPWQYAWSFREGESQLGQRVLPLNSVGAYVPGGKAIYPSSVIMNCAPAKVAGVARVAVTTPAGPDGSLAPAVLVAARTIGLSEIYKIGGAAAVAALALGTESIERVDKVVGPGNRFVNEAKRQLWGQVGLDGYAGPSEVCVLADDDANPVTAAADLLTQLEHSEDNAGFLVTLSRAKAEEILSHVEAQLDEAPRADILRVALERESLAVVARSLEEACEVIDAIAPEHLTLALAQPERALPLLHNAGCILLGEHTPESGGDYAFGPSHTLPTSGAARFQSPLNVLDFLKLQSLVRFERQEMEALAPVIEAFGEMEGFPAHARGVSIRLNRPAANL
jgi:histidinol dehydrogenase